MAVKQQDRYDVLNHSVPIELNGRRLEPNRRMPLNLEWVEEIRINTSAVERRANTIGTRRTVKKEWQAAWLLRAIACMDLTTLSGDDSVERVKRLCAKARRPLQQGLVEKLGIEELELTTRGGLRLPRVCGDGGEGVGGYEDSGGGGFDGLSGGAFAAGRAGAGDSALGGGGSAGD